jgi:hypothetical protein
MPLAQQIAIAYEGAKPLLELLANFSFVTASPSMPWAGQPLHPASR